MTKKRKDLCLIAAVAATALVAKSGMAWGQTATYTWNGNAGDGIWQTGASQTNWNGNVYNPGNGGGNNFVFVDPAYNQSITTIHLTNGHNPNVDNLNLSTGIVAPIKIVVDGGNANTHLDMEAPSTGDAMDINATGCEIDSTTVNGISGAIQLFGNLGIWSVNSTLFTVNAPIADTGPFNRGFIKRGNGTLVLGGQSSFDGALIAETGTTQLNFLANQGYNSSAGTGTGTGSNGIEISNCSSVTFRSGAITYNGPSISTNRPLTIAKDTRATPATTDTASFTTLGNTVTLNGGIATNTTGVNPTIFTTTSLGGAGNIIVNSVGLTGDLALTKIGAGYLQLNAPSTYPGNTLVSGGTLTLNSSDSNSPIYAVAAGTIFNIAGSGAISPTAALQNSGTVNFSSGVAGTFGGAITKTGSIGVSAGSLVLSGTNTYSGTTTVSGGNLLFSGNGALSSSTKLVVGSGATVSFADGTARSTAVPSLNLAGGAIVGVDYISGGTDTLALSAAAIETGNVVVNVSASTPTSGTYTLITAPSGLNAATYTLANTTNFTGTLTSTATSLKLTATQANPLATAYWFGGQVTGAASAMAISSGTASNWSQSATDTTATAAGVVPGAATDVYFSNTNGAANQESAIVLGANMTVNSLNFNDPVPVTINADGNAITLNSAGSAINVNSSATINANINLGAAQTWNIASGQTLTTGGSIDGPFPLTLAGGGSVVFNGSSYYSGATTVSAGSLTIGSTGYLASPAVNVSSGATLTVLSGGAISPFTALANGGTTNFNNAAQTIASLNGAGGLNLNGTSLAVTGGGSYSGSIGGTGSLNLSGGTLNLSASNAYTGGTQVLYGATLTVASTGSLAASTSLVADGTVNLNNSAQLVSSLNGIGTLNLNGTVLNVTGGGSVSGVIAGTGSLNLSGGTLALSGADTYTGPTAVSSGASLAVTNSLASSTALADAGTVTFSNAAQSIASLSGSGNLNLSGTALTVTGGGAFSGPITGTGSLIVSGNSLTLSGINTYSGTTNVSSGATLMINSGGALSLSTSLVDSGTINFNNSAQSVASLNGSGNLNLNGTSLTISGGGNFSGVIGSTGSLTVIGNTLTVSAAQAYSGTTNVSNGATLTLSSTGSLPSSAQLNNSGTVNFNNASQSITSFNGNGQINLNGTALTVTGGGTFTGAIADNGSSGSLVAAGGVLTLSGNSNYSGSTVVSGGTLLAAAVNTLSPNSAVNLSNGTLDVSGFNNSIAALNVGNAGTLNLGFGNVLTDTGSASFAGTLNVTTGTISSNLPETLITYTGYTGSFTNVYGIPSADTLSYTPTGLLIIANGPSALTYLNNGGTWDSATTPSFNGSGGATVFHTGDNVTFDDSNPTGPYTVTISGTVAPGSTTFNTSNNSPGYVVSGGGIAGTGSLSKYGTGTVTLSSSNSYTGGTNVVGGTLVLASAGAFPSNANTGTGLIVGPSAQLTLANHGTNATCVPLISSLTNNGTIDITNNALVIQNATASIGTISSEIAQAYNNGAWNGTNSASGVITSSTAAADSTHLTALGVTTGLITFEGLNVSPDDVLVKYTYYGDTNLDGVVDGTDYSRIDNGYLAHLTGWSNGDFNFDGVIDGSDYTLIDNAFNTQGTALSSEIATATAQVAVSSTVSAVPEPASLTIAGLFAVGLLGRRRRCQ
jgi:autotransporter-associated beta strand protein